MDADYDIHEIVKVIPDFWLLDAESYQRSYSTNHSNPLMPGYYVVTWPEVIRVRRFNENAAFHGPYETRLRAQAFLNTMKKYRYQLIPQPKQWTRITTNTNQQVENKAA